MSHKIDRDNHSGDSAGQGESEPRKTTKKVTPCRPFGIWRRRLQLSQRQRAKYHKCHRYSDMPDSDLFVAVRWLDKCWEGARIRITRTGSNAWIAMFTGVLTVVTIVQLMEMSNQNEIMRLEKRAWVGFSGARIKKPYADNSVGLEIEIQNTGLSALARLRVGLL